MERNIKEAFEEITMPEALDTKIQSAMTRKPHKPLWRPIAAAACLALIVFVLAQPQVVQAVEQVAEAVVTQAKRMVYSFADGSITAIPKKDSQGYDYYTAIKHPKKDGSPSWLDARVDGLYFIGDRQEIEISKLISEETPFTYVFTDAGGIRHHIAVGGVYTQETNLSLVGWMEWFQKEPYGFEDWISGYGRGYVDTEIDKTFGWVAQAEEILGVPWHVSD